MQRVALSYMLGKDTDQTFYLLWILRLLQQRKRNVRKANRFCGSGIQLRYKR